MRELLKQTVERLSLGQRVVWCVILSAQGSTPRGAGAKMAVFEDGTICGTVGGGAVEHQAIGLARSMGEQAFVRGFRLHSGGSEDTGMVCGGSVEIAFLPLSARSRALLEEQLKSLSTPGDHWLRLDIEPDGSFGHAVIDDLNAHSSPGAERPSRTPTLERKSGGGWTFSEPVSRNYRVWIFGGGHVSAALVPVLLPLGFPVTVFDSRPELALPERFPGAEVLCGDFNDFSDKLTITARDYVVVMTPGHEMDLEVLRQALRTPATYVGCIGSRRKTAYVNQKLREEGFSAADLARIHAPIGLPIQARTPEEISISIAAELILHRAGGSD